MVGNPSTPAAPVSVRFKNPRLSMARMATNSIILIAGETLMSKLRLSRRNFLGASAAGGFAVSSALSEPGRAAAQAVGVKPADLPDLTIH
jgi:hypothetical protein